jgi:hypothetical protein
MVKSLEQGCAVDDELDRALRGTPFFENLDELAAYRAAQASAEVA